MKTVYKIHKIRNLISYSLWLFAFSFINSSCKKLVEVPTPTSSLVTTDVFENDASAISAQLNVYVALGQQDMNNLDVITGIGSDELTNYSNVQTTIDFYKNALNAQSDGG